MRWTTVEVEMAVWLPQHVARFIATLHLIEAN
jgi:hypothetical protein